MAKLNSLRSMTLITACLSLPFSSFSQHLLQPNQPEQDACHALPLCGGKFTTPYSYQGRGLVADLPNTPCGSGEDNSMWLTITIGTPGKLAFKIIPRDTVDDYDFAVLEVSQTLCSQLSSSNVVRCNFNNNFPGSNPLGIVGLNDTATMQYVQGGQYGWSFAQDIDVTPGQVYLIMINNFGNDNISGGSPSAGFTIDFSASTAKFHSNPPPGFDSVVRQCNENSLVIQFTKPILCSSIAADGSQFSISPPISISGASGINCINDSGYTSQVRINFAGQNPPGSYTVTGQQGTSGLVITDLCGDAMTVSGSQAPSLPFTIQPPVTGKFLPPDTTKCNYSTISIIPTRTFASYAWNTGQFSPSIAVTDPGVYTLHVTDSSGCAGADSIDIRDSTCPQYVYIPTAFTPNGDGRNDIFKVKFAGPTSDFKLAVYDRWGRMVFETANPWAGWDGTTAGIPQPAGTYAWVCIYRLFQQPQRMQRGTVILIR